MEDKGHIGSGHDSALDEGSIGRLMHTVAGSRQALRVLARMRREEPALGRMVVKDARLVIKAITRSGAPACVSQQVEDVLDLLVARLYEGLKLARARVWSNM